MKYDCFTDDEYEWEFAPGTGEIHKDEVAIQNNGRRIKKVDGGREENGDIMHWIYYTSKNLASRLFYVSSGVSNESSTEIQFSF